MARILVSGLNPAWQKVMEFSALHAGEVNRARTLLQLASGKGMNAAKVLRRLGHEVYLLQILGGAAGKRCAEACSALGIKSLHAWVECETRQCMTLLEGNGRATEIIEPFAVEDAGLGDLLLERLPAGPIDALVISGSIPSGGPADFYDLLLERLHPRVAVVDTAHEIAAAAMAKAFCAKVNRKEYEALPVRRREAADSLFLVTDGAGEASAVRGGKTSARFRVPRLENPRNPIGAGDTVTAGLTHFLLEGAEPEEAFRRGLAMGSASCLRLEPAEYDEASYADLLPKVKRVDHG